MTHTSVTVAAALMVFLFLAALPTNPALANTDTSVSENFTVIVLPDTQGYSRYYPWIFDNLTQWIVNNQDALNIVFVTQLGDLVDDSRDLVQWETANHSMSILDGNVPCAVLPGNHDQFNGNYTNFNTYFGLDRFSSQSWFGGSYADGDSANTYGCFSAGGNTYLLLNLQYNPSDDVLFWANGVINQHPESRVIVSTHDYLMGLYRQGQRSEIGERIWHSLIRPNVDRVFLVLCGHAGAEDQIADTVNGHVVYQLLSDFQNADLEVGWLRLLEFKPAQNMIEVKTFSPTLNQYRNDSQSEFTLQCDLTSEPIPEFPEAMAWLLILAASTVAVLCLKRKPFVLRRTAQSCK
ncbi:MAG: metallophosphoesterase [Candidatus Bathyarchaeota archaeon]|nr:metallophosphoesterase [Candidatus Bathyarchaeota archaeon]